MSAVIGWQFAFSTQFLVPVHINITYHNKLHLCCQRDVCELWTTIIGQMNELPCETPPKNSNH